MKIALQARRSFTALGSIKMVAAWKGDTLKRPRLGKPLNF
jgi:hypothetical protein